MVVPKTNMSLFWTKMAENNLEKFNFDVLTGKHAFLKVFISGSMKTAKSVLNFSLNRTSILLKNTKIF